MIRDQKFTIPLAWIDHCNFHQLQALNSVTIFKKLLVEDNLKWVAKEFFLLLLKKKILLLLKQFHVNFPSQNKLF